MVGLPKNAIEKGKETSFQKLYLHKHYEEVGVSLVKSKAIKRGFVEKTPIKNLPTHMTYSSRVRKTEQDDDGNVVLGGTLHRGIQLYRHWFRYLKLALELEKQNAEVVVRNNYTFNHDRRQWFIPKELKVIKVDASKYEGWDLDQVLDRTFDKWWETHSFLFEGHFPELMKSVKDFTKDKDFIQIKVDKFIKWEDFQQFLTDEVKPQFKSRDRFAIEGRVRPDQLTNRYNALVLTMMGWSSEKICNHRDGYFRAPEEKGDRSNVGGAIEIPVSRQKDGRQKPLYSRVRMRFYDDGIFHLLEVCEGRFGSAPPNKRKSPV